MHFSIKLFLKCFIIKFLLLSYYFTPDFCAGSFRCQSLADSFNNNGIVDSVTILTTSPQRYGHMDNVSNREKIGKVNIIRFNTPEHKNKFYRQVIAYSFFAFKAIKYSLKHSKDYNYILSTSSRLGTAFAGFIISRFSKKPHFLDLRDVFSDNLSSLKFSNNIFGKIIIKIIKKIEILVTKNANWINIVSSGFLKYKHIQDSNVQINIFTNGIDKVFIDNRKNKTYGILNPKLPLQFVYAGNMGLGQSLEKTVIPMARHFGDKILFQLIGDGSSIHKIKNIIIDEKLTNIQLIPPVKRTSLMSYYNNADVLFLQLNDIPAFENVLPSKIFDYGSFDKPILAGVNGTSKFFLEEHMPYSYIYEPNNYHQAIKLVDKILIDRIKINNDVFVEKFSREKIMNKFVKSIISTIKKNKL